MEIVGVTIFIGDIDCVCGIDKADNGGNMPATVILKTMPRGCYNCPFFDSVAFDYEICCSVLDYNEVKYKTNYKTDYEKNRLKECPLRFMSKDYTAKED